MFKPLIACLAISAFLSGCAVELAADASDTTSSTAPTSAEGLPTATPASTYATESPSTAMPENPTPLAISYLDMPTPGIVNVSSIKLSADGRHVVIANNGLVFLYDRETGEAHPINVDSNGQPLGGYVSGIAIAGDGRTVAFWSTSSDLHADAPEAACAPDPRQCASLFLYDVAHQTLEKIAVGAPIGGVGGVEPGTALSSDGRHVVFWADGLLYSGTYLFDRSTGTFSQISQSANGADISADGHLVAFVLGEDVFVLDRRAGSIEQVNLTPDGQSADGISGSHVFHEGRRPDLSLSADGRFVVFASTATNLVANDLQPCRSYFGEMLPACRHIYLFDRETGSTELVSVASTGTPGDHESLEGIVSGDGRFVLFTSFAGNLTENSPCRGYQMPCPQVYLRDREQDLTFLISGWVGFQPNNSSFASDITADGRFAAFTSRATNLLPNTMQRGEQGAFIADLFRLLAIDE